MNHRPVLLLFVLLSVGCQSDDPSPSSPEPNVPKNLAPIPTSGPVTKMSEHLDRIEKRISRVVRPAVATEMPGNHPAAYDTCAFVQRLPGETTSDLMNGILQATMNVTGIKDGLGVNEAAAEVRLPDGSVFEAIGFGPKRQELRKGCVEFAVVTQRGVAFWSESGLSLVTTG